MHGRHWDDIVIIDEPLRLDFDVFFFFFLIFRVTGFHEKKVVHVTGV